MRISSKNIIFATMKNRPLILLLFPLLFSLASPPARAQEDTRLIQKRLHVAHGHYSGITHTEDDLYAVVHDKAQGGGLFFYTITLREDGTPAAVMAFESDAGGPADRDNEDLVYVPETRTLFVASEGDQQIREYRLDGRPTGRSLRIPSPLQQATPQAGFESLAYADRCFWTTTEAPLPGDSLYRLQTFSLDDLAPGKSYSYRADKPVTPPGEAASARAYVFGISALTVLPDGQLVVLEREVHVPSGSLFKMLQARTWTKLYRIDPLHDTGVPLRKTLLAGFSTGAARLANYEGLCLGPRLPDGRQTLLLVADSQNGSHGLTKEYLSVLILN